MGTPYTLMRCRMKGLISCFNACKLPVEKDTDESDNQKPTPSSVDDNPNRETEEKMEIGVTAENGGGEESPASWRSCESEEEEEDDYIVFYFKDDAAADGSIIEERSLETSLRRNHDVILRRKKKSGVNNEELNESGELIDTLGESSDSSTSSFAFPTVQREWTGSPVLMPTRRIQEVWGCLCTVL